MESARPKAFAGLATSLRIIDLRAVAQRQPPFLDLGIEKWSRLDQGTHPRPSVNPHFPTSRSENGVGWTKASHFPTQRQPPFPSPERLENGVGWTKACGGRPNALGCFLSQNTF